MAHYKVQLDAFLTDLIIPFARTTGLEKLPEWFPTITYYALGYTFIHVVVGPTLSKMIVPKVYGSLNSKAARNNWNMHIVSCVNCSVLIFLAFQALYEEDSPKERALGWNDSAGRAGAAAAGFFVWDAADAIVNYHDFTLLVHGLASVFVYGLLFRPFLPYYSGRFLLWELSTPFLNIHWFLDKLGKTGSTLQWINGIILISTFFGARLLYGWYSSYSFWHALIAAYGHTDSWIIYFYGLLNIILNTLNIIWFSKMIAALRKRFDADVTSVKKKQ